MNQSKFLKSEMRKYKKHRINVYHPIYSLCAWNRKAERGILRSYKRKLKRILKIREFLREGWPFIVYNFEILMDDILHSPKPKKHLYRWNETRNNITYRFMMEMESKMERDKYYGMIGDKAKNIMFSVFKELRGENGELAKDEIYLEGLDYYDFQKEIEKHDRFVVECDCPKDKYSTHTYDVFYLFRDGSCIVVNKFEERNLQLYRCGNVAEFLYMLLRRIDRFGTIKREWVIL